MTVTVGVKCFNNVRYIREALESAFRQTYRPLEIVVCDDCSTDGSWEAIGEVVEAHLGEPGLHVVVERNESNLGNLGNWERICGLATGDYIVKFDGDDVSEPDRVSRIVTAIESARGRGLSPTVVGHGGWMISPSGRPMGAMYPAARGNVVGAAMAFSRRCFTEFGHAECDPRIVDDELYAYRGMMLGDFVEMNDRLVRYRCGTGVSNALVGIRRALCRGARELIVALGQCERDLMRLGLDDAGVAKWRNVLSGEREKARSRLELIEGETMRRRLNGARKVCVSGRGWRFLRFAFILPRWLGDPCLYVYSLARYFGRRLKGLSCHPVKTAGGWA